MPCLYLALLHHVARQFAYVSTRSTHQVPCNLPDRLENNTVRNLPVQIHEIGEFLHFCIKLWERTQIKLVVLPSENFAESGASSTSRPLTHEPDSTYTCSPKALRTQYPHFPDPPCGLVSAGRATLVPVASMCGRTHNNQPTSAPTTFGP